ncbi:siderophore-interacting protein [Labrys monachus]|uniref:NADPH-dependent ferric siderophore reductase n=1 Tax=Labrys monachus TaxID=217067 RepID=A0ABU0FJN1_9HYPH|nr:siderophore-interacting protein [Labrys monachus]MDQ0394823.1 NADPH-dependent ferric siderophore reductase [Labrys monachus]
MTETASESRPGRLPAHRVTVTGIEFLTPNMRRITFQGDTLATVSVPLPAQWLKVVLPVPEEKGRANRAYTIRHFYPGWRTMDIDFVLHGDRGPASAWARCAMVGDVVHLGNPRGGHRMEPDARWRLLAGDETALPAIASILDALPIDGIPTWVVIEVPSMDDAQPLRRSETTEVHWIARDGNHGPPGCLLEDRISSLSLSGEEGQVFLAGEAAAVKKIRRGLGRRVPQAIMDAKGYWLQGQADHRDKS